MAQKTCPHCGTTTDSYRSVCPNCRAKLEDKSALTPYLIVAGIIVVVILVIVVLFMNPGSGAGGIPTPTITVPQTTRAVIPPTPPSCTIAIAGSKVPPSSVQLRVMTSTCAAGDVSKLTVMVNGQEKGTLGANPGASGTFAGNSAMNSVIVVAKYSNGAEQVVFQNAAL